MKNIFLLPFFFILSNSSFAQDSTLTDSSHWLKQLSVFAGTGYPELINGGVRLQYNQKNQIGLLANFYRSHKNETKVFIIAAEHFSHFGKEKLNLQLPEFFFRTSFTYLIIDVEKKGFEILSDQYFGIEFALGKNFLFRNIGGISADIGFLSILYKMHDADDTILPLYPSFRLQVFINSKK